MTTLAATAASPGRVQPLHVFAWIVDSGLGDSLKSLAHAILRRVDSRSWRWPRRHGARGGVTVADLADGAGVSRRHAARCLRGLEEMGLVRTTFRPFEVSEYELLVGAWRSRATRHRSTRAAEKLRTREQRIAAFNARRAAARGGARPAAKAVAPASPDRVPGATSPASTALPIRTALPAWAQRHARRLSVPAATVFSMVGGAAAAILGDDVDPMAQGGLARPVLRLWDGRGRPDPDHLAAELALLARWARESVHPDALSLRGVGRRDGTDRSRDARALCDGARFEQWLSLARQHGAAQTVIAPSRPSEPADSEPPLPRRGDPPWIPPGQPAFLPGIGPRAEALVDAWAAALHRLRGSEEHDRGAIDIFLSPLRPIALRDGVVVVAAPSADSARWIGRHLIDELAELSRSIGAPLGLVVDREAAP